MVRRRRPRFNQTQRAELWRRWRQGETLQAIGRALDWATPCVRYFVAETGGVPPPPQQQRSRVALTVAEREEISRGLAYGLSCALEFSWTLDCERVLAGGVSR